MGEPSIHVGYDRSFKIYTSPVVRVIVIGGEVVGISNMVTETVTISKGGNDVEKNGAKNLIGRT